jgi:hypothetical protein
MKSGIDYFPLDVTLDSKMELMEAEFGLTGFGVVVKLFGEIYGKQGYYIEWTEEVALLFGRKVGLGRGVVSEIVAASVKRGMFDQEVFRKYRVLTSRGIQKRYFEAVSRRKEIEVEDSILLVDPAQFCKNVDIKRRNADREGKNADSCIQRKEEQRRETERKDSARKVSTTQFIPPTVEEVRSFCEERGSLVEAQEFIDFYAAKGWMMGKTPMKDWKAACRNAEKWERWQKGNQRASKEVGAKSQNAERFKADMGRLDKLLKVTEEVKDEKKEGLC